MSVEMNKKRQNNIPNIIDCSLKKDDQILIVFGVCIPDTTDHNKTIKFPPHPTSVSALPRKKIRTSGIRVKINEKRQ